MGPTRSLEKVFDNERSLTWVAVEDAVDEYDIMEGIEEEDGDDDEGKEITIVPMLLITISHYK